jgi:hypothetical protein
VNVEVIRGSAVSVVTLPMPADLGGSGLPVRSDAGRGRGPGMETAAKPVSAGTGNSSVEKTPSPRPSSVTDVDQSDAFSRDPFTGGPQR